MNEFRRRLMVGGIPGHQIEFIQGTGTQYLITNLHINEDTDAVEIEFALNNDIVTDSRLISGDTVDTPTVCLDSNLKYRYYKATNNWPLCGIDSTTNRTVIKVDYKNNKIYHNGIVALDDIGLSGREFSEPLCIGFGSNGNDFHMNFKLYGFKFWRNDKLVFDGIPIELGGEGYLYDKIGRKKYSNEGSGRFICSIELPYDSDIEYLESSGDGCYIDTGAIVNSSTYFKIRYGISKTHAEQNKDARYVHAQESSLGSSYVINCFLTGTEEIRVRWGQTASCNLKVYKNDILTLEKSGNYANNKNNTKGTLQGVQIGSTFPISVPICLLSQGSGRIYFAKIGNLDLTPVRIGQVGYMYDRNSGQLYAQQGEGQPFILGPDINI